VTTVHLFFFVIGRVLTRLDEESLAANEPDEWFAIAKDRPKWRQLTHSDPKPPDA